MNNQVSKNSQSEKNMVEKNNSFHHHFAFIEAIIFMQEIHNRLLSFSKFGDRIDDAVTSCAEIFY